MRILRIFVALLTSLIVLANSIPCMAGELGRIGVTVTDLGNPFFVRIARGVEKPQRSPELTRRVLKELTQQPGFSGR